MNKAAFHSEPVLPYFQIFLYWIIYTRSCILRSNQSGHFHTWILYFAILMNTVSVIQGNFPITQYDIISGSSSVSSCTLSQPHTLFSRISYDKHYPLVLPGYCTYPSNRWLKSIYLISHSHFSYAFSRFLRQKKASRKPFSYITYRWIMRM